MSTHDVVPDESEYALTYGQLLDAVCADLPGIRMPGIRSPQERNHRAAVGAWLKWLELGLGAVIGAEFMDDFSARLTDFEAAEISRGIGRATLRDRRYLLNRIRKRYLQLCSGHLPRSFAEALDALLRASPLTAREVSERTGIQAQLLSLWRRGHVTPNSRTRDLEELERCLGAAPGTLSARLPRAPTGTRTIQPAERTTRFRERMRKLASLAPYRLSYHSAAFQEEWRALLQYKTSELPSLKRQPQGRWRPKSRLLTKAQEPAWAHTLPDGRRVPSAYKWLVNVSHFLGWLTLPAAQGGKDVPLEEAQSLAWLARADLVLAFLRWLSQRSGGANGHTLGFIDTVNALIHPTTGFLTQQPAFRAKLPVALRPTGDWAAYCRASYQQLREARGVLCSSAVQTRDVEEPIQELLALKNPILPLLQMLERMRKAMPPRSAPLRRAQHQRDMLLIALLVSNPLRISHYIFMCVEHGHDAYLYRTSDGAWRIRSTYEAFKNGAAMAKRARGHAQSASRYDVEVAHFVTPYLESYLAEGRKLLLAGRTSALLFVGQSTSPVEPLLSLDARVQELTARYIPDSPGFRAHAVRHLVATAFLRKFPRDYVRLAHLLCDSLETVLRIYAHLEQDETLLDWGAEVGTLTQTVHQPAQALTPMN